MSRTVTPFAYKRDDHVGQPVQAALALADQLRVEGAVPVPRGGQIEVADLGAQPFRGRPVAGVPRPLTGRVALLIAQMIGQLDPQTRLQRASQHLREEPALPGQPQLTGVDLGHHLVEQAGLDHRIDRLPRRLGLRHRRLTERALRLRPDRAGSPAAAIWDSSCAHSPSGLLTQTI